MSCLTGSSWPSMVLSSRVALSAYNNAQAQSSNLQVPVLTETLGCSTPLMDKSEACRMLSEQSKGAIQAVLLL